MTGLAQTGPRFEFVLYPNPPLSTQGFALFMAAVGLVSGAVGAAFVLLGAWPVTGFLGLDVLALFLAFRWIRRRSQCVEIVRIAADGLIVRCIRPDRPTQDVSFEPYWTRVQLEGGRGTACHLSLRSHGRALEIGRFLTPPEKRELAQALEEALASLRTAH